MSNFFEIDFATNHKTNDKKSRRFDPIRGHFQVGVTIYKISINMFLTVKILKNVTNGRIQ